MLYSNGEDKLESLTRVDSVAESEKYKDDVFLLPRTIAYKFREDNLFELHGISDKWDKKRIDLIRVIHVLDSLNIKYQCTNILTPLAYAESREDILWHLNTQGVFVSKIEHDDVLKWIKKESKKKIYGKHEFDIFWLPFGKSIEQLKLGDVICVFNRRVAGWDGSRERPVIELLGAGGHLPVVFDRSKNDFRMLSIVENMQKETFEELGITLSESEIAVFGGYTNYITHELVVLTGVKIPDVLIPEVLDYAIQNLDGDTMGIYLGFFDDVIDYYRRNPEPFAGGKKAAPCNFPNQIQLMKRVSEYLKNM